MRRELTHGSLFSGIEGFGIIGDVRPDYVIIENSPQLRKRGLEYVLHGLSEIGFSAAILTVGTSTSISGMGRAMGLTRTPHGAISV